MAIEKEKGYDAIMIEFTPYGKEKTLDENSLVCISPYDIKTKKWLVGLMEIIPLKYVLKMKKKKVAKDRIVQDFLEKYYKKKGKRE